MARDPRFDEDDYDDLDIGPRRYRPEQHPTNAGMIGFVLSLGCIGILGAVGVLWYLMELDNQRQINLDRTRGLMILFTVLVITSFFVAVTATFFSGRGLAPSNPLYRGYAAAGLILGIVEIIITAIASFFLSCCVGLTELMRNAGG
jgi:hypothetical protein